jgi:prepilin-type N-terminal cleavage/methylation domain-containing protein
MFIDCFKRCGRGKFAGGFTLVELLVVVAVIAMLLAILLPTLRLARAVSKKTICQSNLKQLACAWSMYLEHYDGYFYQETNANMDYGGWRGTENPGWVPRPLNRWVGLAETLDDEKSAEVFCCPADKGGVFQSMPRERSFRLLGTSYRTNIFLIGPGQHAQFSPRTKDLDLAISSRLRNLRISQMTAGSAHLVLMGDQGWMFQWMPMSPLRKQQWEQDYKPYAEWHIKPEHYNLAFMDGHTAFVKIRKAYYVTDDYSVVPFKELYGLAYQVQGEEP